MWAGYKLMEKVIQSAAISYAYDWYKKHENWRAPSVDIETAWNKTFNRIVEQLEDTDNILAMKDQFFMWFDISLKDFCGLRNRRAYKEAVYRAAKGGDSNSRIYNFWIAGENYRFIAQHFNTTEDTVRGK